MNLTKHRLPGPLLTLLVLASLSGLASAEIYRWTDANGQVHFGERPPADVQAESVKPPPPPALSPDLGSELRSQFKQRQADYTSNRQASREAAANAAAEAAERAKNCAQSRAAIADINKFMNKRMFDSNGNYIESDARQAKLNKARESVEYWCD